MIGIVNKIMKPRWEVYIMPFHYKFDMKGSAVNFCIKYNIPLEKMFFNCVVQIIIPQRGDIFYYETKE